MYLALFKSLRLALIKEFGDVGGSKVAMFDMEPAAHKAMKEVFPEWSIKSCFFHFIKSVINQAKKKVSKDVRDMIEFKQWVELFFGRHYLEDFKTLYVLGAVFLEPDRAKKVFENLLVNLPNVGENKLASFVEYMRTFWLPKIEKITCWDDDKPRTTNPAETYHRKLAGSFQQ